MGATAVSVASGAKGTVVTTNSFDYDGSGGRPAVAAVDAPGTVIVSNTFSSRGSCNTAISLTGSSTGSTMQNNAVELGANSCYYGTTTPVVIGSAAISGTKEDYNTVETASTGALFSWAGQSYTSLPAYQAASGQGAHDSSLALTSGATTLKQIEAPLIDAADANAPDEFNTDLTGRPRVDDPTVVNTGTGVGYYDRGAVEFQDPYALTATLSATKLPTGGSETVAVSADNPWNTQIAGYSFDFGDGSAPVASATATASHAYTTPGWYTVTVTATSTTGATFQTTADVQAVAPAPLVAGFTTTRPSGLTVQVYNASTGAWNVTSSIVDFGDGSAPVTFPAVPITTPSHTYARPGTYTITLTTRDANGNQATTTQPVSVGSAFVSMAPVRILVKPLVS
jgi:PKD repeat protein